MNHTFKITGVHAIPAHLGRENVVAKVNWEIVFSQDGQESLAAGETFIDTNVGEEFTPLEQVTAQQIQDWVLAKEGGDAFITMLEGIHGPMLANKAVAAKVVPAATSFALATPTVVHAVTYDLSAIQ